MLEALAQVQNEDGTITFTQVPQYDSGDPNTINAVVKGLEENSPSLLSVAFYTQESAKYIDNRVNRINLIIDSKEDLTRALNAIKNNTHLTELTLCGYEITHKDYEALKADEPAKELVYALGNAVAKNPSLKTLRLYHAKLSGFLAYVLGCILEENTEISSLCLSESTLFDFGLEQIAEALKKNHFITQMDITNIKDPNNIGARIMPIFAGLAGGTGITRNATESLEKSLTRNREFAKRRAALEEKFWALVQKRVIPKSLVTTEKSISSVQRGLDAAIEKAKEMLEELAINRATNKELLDIVENISVRGFSTLQDVEEIKKDVEEVKRIKKEKQKKLHDIELIREEKKRSEIISLLEEMLDIVDQLKTDGYSGADKLLHRVKCAEAEFYFSIDQIEKLFALERDHFATHPESNFNFQLAEKIFVIDDVALRSLGLSETRLKYQYIIKLLEGNQTSGANKLCKSAYLKLQGKDDIFDDRSFEASIDVDRILTNDEFQQLFDALISNNHAFYLFYKVVQIAKDTGQTSSTSSTSSVSSPFSPSLRLPLFVANDGENAVREVTLKELLDKLPAPDKSSVEQILTPMFTNNEKPDLKHLLNLLFDPEKFLEDAFPKQEKFAAQVLIDIFEGKKVAVYSQLRQKNANEPVKLLNLMGASNQLNINEFMPCRQADLKLKDQVYLKHALAQSFADGVYANVFNSPSAENITGEHSRILSATRLATLSSKFTYAQMVNILQIEYAALPDDDKKDDPSFFTSYRHRTLEKALEVVFEKEAIPQLKRSEIEADKDLQLAFKIFQWIGETESSFYYKISKNQTLFTSMETLGNLAHEIIVCDKENTASFTALKNKVQTEIDQLSSHVDVRSLELAMIKTDHLDLDKRITTLEKYLGFN